MSLKGIASGCSLAGDVRSALEVRGRMAQGGVPPSVHSYNALIAAAERGGAWDAGIALRRTMQAEGILPNQVPHTTCTERWACPLQHCCGPHGGECCCLLANTTFHFVVRGLRCILASGDSAADDGLRAWRSPLCGVSECCRDGTFCRSGCCWQYVGPHWRLLTPTCSDTREYTRIARQLSVFAPNRLKIIPSSGWHTLVVHDFVISSPQHVYAFVSLFQVTQSGILFPMRIRCDSVVSNVFGKSTLDFNAHKLLACTN